MIQRTASELAELCDAVLEGDGAILLVGPAALDEARADQVSFVRSGRHAAGLAATRAGAVLVPCDLPSPRTDLALLRCADPSRAFSRVVEAFRPPLPPPAVGIHPSAVVHPSARIGAGASIGALCVVAEGAEIGARVVLHPQVVVGPLARVGEDSVLCSGVVLYERVELGRRCLIHAGTVLGSDGFGFEQGPAGWEKVPQYGTVLVGDDVEMGANCAIDRGRFDATRIGNGVKLDNLVHLAHNVVVEDGTLLLAQVGVAGSTRIGARAILAGQVGVAGHLSIGAGARIGAQSGVGQDIAPGHDHFGSPSRAKGETLRIHTLSGKLPELFQRVRALEKELAAARASREETR
ncbi:MAG: UDP-3-O-(3-hydroxymyristoyl)glucosamine N-acyltransferase [Planctomycetes bacterium]|nr:UDP-3-O-(3-hydroxymyristoyl)glucosamine N-acyltransferase [Planctomycetota bacterium]